METSETFDPLRSRPPTPTKIVWYDFLLDESLLEKHLAQDNPDPSALHLVAEFVYQYQCTLHQLRDAKSSSLPPEGAKTVNGSSAASNHDSNGVGDANIVVEENRKCLALRLLALKVLAYLNWDLSFFDTKLPLCMVNLLLTEFLRMTAVSDERLQGLRPSELDLNMLPDHTVFSLLLYYRWCLRTMVDSTMPKKPTKTLVVNVPGLQDPTVVPPGSYENTVKMVREQIGEAVILVEQFLQTTRSVLVVPNLVSLGQLSEAAVAAKDGEGDAKPAPPSILLRWELGTQVPEDELVCQAAYDLGVYYFHIGDYDKAGPLLQTCGNLFSQVQDSAFCTLNYTDLDGYMEACSDVTGEKISPVPKKPSLVDRLWQSEKSGLKDLPSILAEDNLKLQIPRSMRESFVKRNLSSMSLSTRRQVALLNVLRRVVAAGDETVTPDELVDVRIYEKSDATAFFKAFEPMVKCHGSKKANFRLFLLQLLPFHVAPQQLNSLVENKTLSSVLSTSDLEFLVAKPDADLDAESVAVDQLAPACLRLSDWPLSSDGMGADKARGPRGGPNELTLGSLEHRLIRSRSGAEIFQILHQMRKMSSTSAVGIHQMWESLQLTAEIYNCLSDKFDQDYVTILFAKAFQSLQMKAFDEARELLLSAKTHCLNLPHGGKRIAAIAEWETLLVGLVQYRETETVSASSGVTASDLVNQAKNCWVALNAKPGAGGLIPPSIEVVEQSVAFLINIKEWSTLWGSQPQMNNHMEMGRLVCNTCKELPNTNNARKPAKDLFEAILSIFRPGGFQQKRSVSGNPVGNPMGRENGLLPKQLFLNFLASVKEPVVMTTFISLLSNIFNAIKDEAGKEVHGEHQEIWPSSSVIGDPDLVNLRSLTETLESLVEGALATDPTNASWILTQADLHFANGQHAPAMRHYVEAGFVSSAAFSKTVPKEVYNDTVIRRMIKCCSALKCHTQVTVLCQFLEETDYSIAFKALQEKQVVADAMDNYYDCIWDTTILEYLANLHIRRGEMQRHKLVLQAFGHLDLNPNNAEHILDKAIQLRKSKFLRALSRQYMLS